MDIDSALQSVIPLTAGGLGFPVLLWRIYRWIDQRTRAQLTEADEENRALQTRIAALEAQVEANRQQRLTEVDGERVQRIVAQDDAARYHAQMAALTEENRSLRDQVARLLRPGGRYDSARTGDP